MGAAEDVARSVGIDLTGTGVLPNDQALGLNNVYMGKKTISVPSANQVTGTIEEQDDIMSLNDARMLPFEWDQAKRDKIIREGVLKKIPGFTENMGIQELLSAWDDLVKISAEAGATGHKISPTDIMGTYKSREGTTYKKGNWEYDAITDQPVKYVGPLTKTDTNTRFDLSTREDALALAKTSMAQMLGRSPTQGELSNYMSLLNGYERANPQTSSSTSRIDPTTGEVTSTDTTSMGGTTQAGKAAMLEEQMKQSPEYGAYQASTTYYNAMMQEIMRGY